MDAATHLAKLDKTINSCEGWLKGQNTEVFDALARIWALHNNPQNAKSDLNFMSTQLDDHQEILRKAENEVVGYIHNAILTETLTAETAKKSPDFAVAQNYVERIEYLQKLFVLMRLVNHMMLKVVKEDKVIKASPPDYTQLFETYKTAAILEYQWAGEKYD